MHYLFLQYRSHMIENTKKLVIITGYFSRESYGLLGPQMAATIINDHTDYETIVVGVTNEDDKQDLKTALNHYFKDRQKSLDFHPWGEDRTCLILPKN